MRQLLLAYRRPAAVLNPLFFYGVVVLLMPLGLGPKQAVLSEFAPGLLWITALLAALLSAEIVFRSDYDDGGLEQLVVSGDSMYLASLGYVIAHWCLTGLPLALVSPVFAQLLSLPAQGLPALVISLTLGTLILSAFGCLGASLTVALRRGGMLLSLLLLPLEVPVLILGSGIVTRAVNGMPIEALISILAGLALLAIALTPLAIGASIKISLEV
jgi:heme exporter protein B